MATKLTKEVLSAQVGKIYKKQITDELVAELNALIDDPDYGEEFKEAILTFSSVLEGKDGITLKQYLNAVKFYSLTAAGKPAVKAYAIVFPERLQARLDRGETIANMTGEASRYNSSKAVNKIRQQALVPLHLVNQGTVQKAINTLTDVMLSSRSDMARVSAATTLIKELRPPEVQQVELQVGLSDEALELQNKQNAMLMEVATNQRKLLEAGFSIEEVQSIKVTAIEAEVVENE